MRSALEFLERCGYRVEMLTELSLAGAELLASPWTEGPW